MLRYVSADLRRALLRPLVLALGLLVAATSFSLLTAAVQTGQAEIQGTLNRNFRAAYDILVRPAGAQSGLEKSSGLVRPNFQSGIYGGISEAQWHQILAIPGVEVAAPLANAGVISSPATLWLKLPEAETAADTAGVAYQVAQTWTALHGASTYPGNRDYVYATTDSGGCDRMEDGGDPVVSPEPQSAFQASGPQSSSMLCFARQISATGKGCWQMQPNYSGTQSCGVEAFISLDFPLAVAGIDPVQESKLLGLDHTIVDGRGLTEHDTYSTNQHGAVVPVIASSRTYADIQLRLDIGRVQVPAGKTLPTMLMNAGSRDSDNGSGGYQVLRSLPVTPDRTITIDADQLYQQALDSYAAGLDNSGFINEYWTPGPVAYERNSNGVLAPRTVEQDPYVYQDGTGIYGWAYVNPASADVQYRQLQIHVGAPTQPGWGGQGQLDVVGRFDPTKLPHFSALSQVPLETYNPPVATAGDAATARVLAGEPYRPTLNIGGYLLQPPQLLTTLQGIQGLTSSRFYRDGADAAFISVIRVRVAGVHGADDVSIARIKTVAAQIHDRTGLDVDITAGSSPAPQLVQLHKSPFGAPPLLLKENWVAKGVAIAIRGAIDRKSLILLAMILVVTVVFLINAGVAEVRARRQELGTLLCLGWRPRQVAGVVLGELVTVGVTAGAAGTGLTFAVSAALGLHQPAWRLALVAPVSVGLAALAGLIPAALAARGDPLDVVAPPVRPARRAPRRSSVNTLALGNLRAARGRSLLAATALFLGVAALSTLLAINLAFRGTVVGTLLGDVVAVQVRSSDYISVALVLLLAAIALTDVLVLGMRERAVELVTLRVLGWSDWQLGRLVLTEGLGIGLLAAIPGAAAGAAIGLALRGSATVITQAAVAALATGIAAALLASLGPAIAVSRLPIGVASAEA